jgi:hypothetical protein
MQANRLNGWYLDLADPGRAVAPIGLMRQLNFFP